MFGMQGRYSTPPVSHLRAELETLSKDQLIDLLLKFAVRSPEEDLVDLIQQPEGRPNTTTGTLRRPDAIRPFDLPWEVHEYTKLPVDPLPGQDAPLQALWRLALISFDLAHTIIGLETCGDIVIGRAEKDFVPDLDLTAHHAVDYGVSRRHALLHPTDEQLLLTDLGSTNGTRRNDLLLDPFQPVALQDRDIIIFGGLQFQLRIAEEAG